MKHKYIVDELGNFMIFSDCVQHIDVAHLLMSAYHTSIIGAGFISLADGKVHCYGKSLSLGIPSRGAYDDDIIAENLELDIMQ